MALLTLSKRQGLPGDFNPKTGRPRRGGSQGQVDRGISIVDLIALFIQEPYQKTNYKKYLYFSKLTREGPV